MAMERRVRGLLNIYIQICRMSMHAHIVYYNFLSPDGEEMSIGGVQTYLVNLIPVLRHCGFTVTVYQRSFKDFHREFDTYDVYGLGLSENDGPQVAKALLDTAQPHLDLSSDLLLYGCETCVTRVMPCRTIAIQHGVSWDVPLTDRFSKVRYLRNYVGKGCRAWNTIHRVNKVDYLVCVDHNFVNWYKAVAPYPEVKHIVIPNFTAIPSTLSQKNGETLQIIFARRFFIHRGTRLFANVMERILKERDNIQITIAGTGPDADYLHAKLDQFGQVQFITFDSKDSLGIHQDKDIAVVPTIGSEGTSLSLLEAMASGCAVICTNVGGMTNIVLDGYNGLMISPDEENLYKALNRLIDDHILRTMLQSNAYATVKSTFSLENWQMRWMDLIEQVKIK